MATEVRLSWTYRTVVDEFAGAVLSLQSLCDFAPEMAEQLRRAAVRELDEPGRQLVVALAAQITEAS